MTLKKKIVVTTVAASLVFGALAGPLSTKGLAEKLGVSVASASATLPTTANDLKARLNKLYDNLSVGEKTTISNARDQVQVYLNGKNDTELATIFDTIVPTDVWTRIDAKTNVTDHPLVTKANIMKLVLNSAIFYDQNLSGLANLLSDPTQRATLSQILDAAGYNGGLDNTTVTFTKLTDVFNKIEAEAKSALSDVLSATLSPTELESRLQTRISNVIAAELTVIGALLGESNDDKAKLTIIKNNLFAITGLSELKNADNAFTSGYLKMIIAERNAGGGIYIPTPTTPSFDQQLKDLEGKLATATGEEKAKLIGQILDAAEAAIAILADIKTSTTLSGNVATADVKVSDVLAQIKAIKDIVDKALKSTGTTLAPEVTLTLNLGLVTADKINTPIVKEIIEAAKANGITNIAVIVNGIAITLPVAEFADNVTLTIAKSTQTTTTVTTSDLFDIDLTVGGKAQSEFNNKLTLSLPVKDVSKSDKELLVVAKVVDGKLQIIGGSLKGNNVSVPRDGLSTYTVVENKVSFNDLTKVQSWAGRQIEVAAAKGILEGRKAGTFDPSANVTRAEFAKLIVKTFFLEDKKATEAFSDVSADAWYGPYVAAAAKLGIITGRNASTFDPNAKISRAEMATMAARALKLVDAGVAKVDVTAALKDFKDAATISASLKEGVAIAAAQGIVIGDNGNFKPQGNSTRAEAAVVIYRLLKSQE